MGKVRSEMVKRTKGEEEGVDIRRMDGRESRVEFLGEADFFYFVEKRERCKAEVSISEMQRERFVCCTDIGETRSIRSWTHGLESVHYGAVGWLAAVSYRLEVMQGPEQSAPQSAISTLIHHRVDEREDRQDDCLYGVF